ncbi:transcription-repair coupling factor [Microvirga lotononidis]|uniref:Transcription-repair-coupling factor n=1 Tax=Microvirga lotononidis TaxID=864069 RepID=I4YW21_9HYPH|nr:helicase-related protein [Microvirga lotononidis]EIM28163.1 transcription-repair coupling factor (superfamily II helicase) [Microvirga lotononidis]WQO27736.1 helicase-related protein [Microvirga lotononidis]
MRAEPLPPQDIRRIDLPLPSSVGLHAVRLLEQAKEAGPSGVVYVAGGERWAEQMAQAMQGLAPGLDICLLPPWDCLPYDRASPSREAMGRRMSVLRRMSEPGAGPRVLITSAAAIIQRVPPRDVVKKTFFAFRAGEEFSVDALNDYLHRAGYVLDERVDEPGEAAIRGQVIDLFPADSALPYRAEHDGRTIAAIRSYDPISQLTEAEVDHLVIGPASEIVLPEAGHGEESAERFDGMEQRLPEFYPQLETLFDYWPDASIVLDAKFEERRQLVMEQAADAYDTRINLRMQGRTATSAVAPERLFIQDDEWADALSSRRAIYIHAVTPDESSQHAVPNFAISSRPSKALADFLRTQSDAGRKIVLVAAARSDLGRLRRRVQSVGRPDEVGDWDAVLDGPSKGWFALQADIKRGFIDERDGIAVMTAFDVLGSRARGSAEVEVSAAASSLTDTGFRIGDAVVHIDHGIGVLQGIESVDAGDAGESEAVRLGYAADTTLLVPATEMDRVWRYGAMSDALSLDRLKGDAWQVRRERIEAEIAETARHMIGLVDARRSKTLESLVPPGRDYERFVARFPFSETADQINTIEAVLEDLSSGRAMDRLVCGDVGFGKTEIALRAAAAVALAGKQVAIVAPTTVLARQHVRSFERRFAGLGIEIAHLSRLVPPSEAQAVKKGLADGSIRLVIGTHALAAKGVAFKDLGLVVIDEEQRFGTAHKNKLRELSAQAHVLTLTATPIPRTLQSALVGLQDLSIIATPPARRQPIRTFLTPFDPASVRDALMRERRRRGQSFVVCSRVEDIEPMRERLAKLVPELDIMVAHGQMPAAETDDVMVRFADGEGDVLLSTNIIESGLDVPRANTMLVWRADRFGMAQLHQLRGRVGRGRVRGTAYLLTEPGQELPQATEKRLRTLTALDRLGAGFAISAQDLDQRGAGALLGDEQAGHVKLIGTDLYQHMLAHALRGGSLEDDWTPDLNIGLSGAVPESYVNEPEMRINLHARIARFGSAESIDDLEAEIEDRFGSIPEPVRNLLRFAHLHQVCRHLGIARIDAGPQAIALTFRPGSADKLPLLAKIDASQGMLAWSKERLVCAISSDQAEERYERIVELLDTLSR